MSDTRGGEFRDHLGRASYGIATEGGLAVFRLFADRESVMPDPVHSAKGAAGLIDLLRNEACAKAQALACVPTGGGVSPNGYDRHSTT